MEKVKSILLAGVPIVVGFLLLDVILNGNKSLITKGFKKLSSVKWTEKI